MSANVLSNSGPGETFQITTRVKQDYVIAPALFSIFVGAILQLSEVAMNGGLFKPNRLQTRTKVSSNSFIELQCADDNVVTADTEDDLQRYWTGNKH